MEVPGQGQSRPRSTSSTSSTSAPKLLVLRFGELAGLWDHPHQKEKIKSTHSADYALNISMEEDYPGQDLDDSWDAARHEISQILQGSGSEHSGDTEAHLGATAQIIDNWVSYASVRFVLKPPHGSELHRDSVEIDPRQDRMKARFFNNYYQGAKLPTDTCQAIADILDRHHETVMLKYRTDRVLRPHLAWDVIKRDCDTATSDELNEYHSLLIYLEQHWLRLDKAQSWFTTNKDNQLKVWAEALDLLCYKKTDTAKFEHHRKLLQGYDSLSEAHEIFSRNHKAGSGAKADVVKLKREMKDHRIKAREGHKHGDVGDQNARHAALQAARATRRGAEVHKFGLIAAVRDLQAQYGHARDPKYHPDDMSSRHPDADAKALEDYRQHWNSRPSQHAPTTSHTQMQTTEQGQAHITKVSSLSLGPIPHRSHSAHCPKPHTVGKDKPHASQ